MEPMIGLWGRGYASAGGGAAGSSAACRAAPQRDLADRGPWPRPPEPGRWLQPPTAGLGCGQCWRRHLGSVSETRPGVSGSPGRGDRGIAGVAGGRRGGGRSAACAGSELRGGRSRLLLAGPPMRGGAAPPARASRAPRGPPPAPVVGSLRWPRPSEEPPGTRIRRPPPSGGGGRLQVFQLPGLCWFISLFQARVLFCLVKSARNVPRSVVWSSGISHLSYLGVGRAPRRNFQYFWIECKKPGIPVR